MTTFNIDKYTMRSDVPKEAVLELTVIDDQTGDEVVELVPIKVKTIPWARKNQIKSLSMSWELDGKLIWDGDHYVRECLKLMIVEAPWGVTNDVFLLSIKDSALGEALEALVPPAFASKKGRVLAPEDVKKGQLDTS